MVDDCGTQYARPIKEKLDRLTHILPQESIDILVKTCGYWCDRCGEPTDDCKRLGCEFD